MSVKPIPDGYHSVTPYLTVPGIPKLIDFVKQAFGAQQIVRMDGPDGNIVHAEVKIGDSIIMMGEANSNFSPMPGKIHLYIEGVDKVYKRALDAGATSLREPTDQFYGDRMAGVLDKSGNEWWISTHTEDLTPEEMKKRSEEFIKQREKK